ncbi:hypothetical protein Btru_000281 [Bulinus truncatus]|nr:hypothetical protein Btru_000281 [Bulinus truncatus]
MHFNQLYTSTSCRFQPAVHFNTLQPDASCRQNKMFVGSLRDCGRVGLIVLTTVWTVSSLARSTYYQQISISRVTSIDLILLAPTTANVSLHQCAALCDLHQNCTTVLYSNTSCQFYGLDYVRSPYPVAAVPALPRRAFYLKSGIDTFRDNTFLLI